MSTVSFYLFIMVLSCCNLSSDAVCCFGKRKKKRNKVAPLADRRQIKTPSFMDLFYDDPQINATQLQINYDSMNHPIPITNPLHAKAQTKAMFTDFKVNRQTLPFLITAMAFDISTLLNFVGFYLPLQNSSILHAFQLQSLVDYFCRFKNGTKGVDMRYIVNNYEEMRHYAVGLWHNQDFNANYKSHAITTNKPFLTNYWEISNKWLSHNDTLLQFVGSNVKSQTQVIKTMSWLALPILMDRFQELITCNDVSIDMHAFNDMFFLLNLRNTHRILLNSYFHNDFTSIEIAINPEFMLKIVRGSYVVAKVAVGNIEIFAFNVLLFLKREKLYLMNKHLDVENFGVKFYSQSKDEGFSIEIQFDTQMFSKKRYQALDTFFRGLVDMDNLSKLRFKDIDSSKHGITLLYILLNFSSVGGRCGFRFQEQKNINRSFVSAIFCQWSAYEYDDDDSA